MKPLFHSCSTNKKWTFQPVQDMSLHCTFFSYLYPIYFTRTSVVTSNESNTFPLSESLVTSWSHSLKATQVRVTQTHFCDANRKALVFRYNIKWSIHCLFSIILYLFLPFVTFPSLFHSFLTWIIFWGKKERKKDVTTVGKSIHLKKNIQSIKLSPCVVNNLTQI